MQQYIQLTIKAMSASERELAIGQLMMSGFEAFEERGEYLIASVKEEDFNQKEVEKRLTLPFSTERIQDRNWNEEWEKSFDPVLVDDFCIIRADFHQPRNGFVHDVIVTPKMSFGTGHHATTFQMIQLMREVVIKNTSVLDFGTGTGVLAILAEKMGAAKVIAIDNDSWSIANAAENIAMNNCRHIELSLKDSLSGLPKFDTILANINKHVILDHLEHIKQHLNSDGVILFSGLLDEDFAHVVQVSAEVNLKIIQRLSKDGWIALTLKHSSVF